MINGKTIFSWNIPEIANGNPKNFAKVLVEGNFEGVLLKAADGNLVHKMKSYSPWPNWGTNVKPSMITELRAVGLKIYLWHYLYGWDPKGELDVAIKQATAFKPDGYVWNSEGSFDSNINAVGNAKLLTEGFEKAFPNIPQALCWWALPKNPNYDTVEWHPIKVAKAFLEIVDCAMPMMYWGGVGPEQAVNYLLTSLGIWKTITNKPLIPIGRAYTGDGGIVNPSAISAFALKVTELSKAYNLLGNSWWSIDKAYYYPDVWSVLKDLPKFGPSDQVVLGLPVEEVLKRLIAEHPSLFPEIFNK